MHPGDTFLIKDPHEDEFGDEELGDDLLAE